MSDVKTLQELLEKRLREMGGPHEPRTLLSAYQALPAGQDWVSYEVIRRVSKGHSRITDRAARTLATMLGVDETVVRSAAGQRPTLGPFELPPRASRLDEAERSVVLSVVDAILFAAEGASRPSTQSDRRKPPAEVRGPTADELAAAREDGRSARIDAAKDEGLGAPPAEREPLANPDLDAAHREGWDSVTDAEREGAFKAAQIASERHDTTLSPRTGGGAHKGQYGTAARRAPRQRTDEVGDGA